MLLLHLGQDRLEEFLKGVVRVLRPLDHLTEQVLSEEFLARLGIALVKQDKRPDKDISYL